MADHQHRPHMAEREGTSVNSNIIPVNNEALSRAMIAVVGEEQTALITKAYQLIDAGMAYGYAQGVAHDAEKSKMAADEYVYKLDKAFERGCAQAAEDAWETGYTKGMTDGADQADAATYDDGYVHGVSDACLWPKYADEQVARLCSADEYDEVETFDNYDDFADAYQGDSGDENDNWWGDQSENNVDDYVFDEDTFDHLEPKENAAVEGEWTPEAAEALKATF